MTIVQEFQTGTVGWEFLFIFISGVIGDMIVHLLGDITKGTKYAFAQGLLKYYESLGEKLLIFNTSKWNSYNKKILGIIQGAIWGGIACVIALLFTKLFLFAKEENENNN
jgi:hypothetical protein